MEQWLKDDERLDYLLAEELRIIQSPSVFSFSLEGQLSNYFRSKVFILSEEQKAIFYSTMNHVSYP